MADTATFVGNTIRENYGEVDQSFIDSVGTSIDNGSTFEEVAEQIFAGLFVIRNEKNLASVEKTTEGIFFILGRAAQVPVLAAA